MIYIAGVSFQAVIQYLSRQGIPRQNTRIVTRPEDLIGLTGGKLFLLHPFYERTNSDEIEWEAQDRSIKTEYITWDTTHEELLRLEAILESTTGEEA